MLSILNADSDGLRQQKRVVALAFDDSSEECLQILHDRDYPHAACRDRGVIHDRSLRHLVRAEEQRVLPHFRLPSTMTGTILCRVS